MNTQHLRAFLWLRWRLRINQLRRAGTVNAVLLMIMAGFALLFALAMFVFSLLLALYLSPSRSSMANPCRLPIKANHWMNC